AARASEELAHSHIPNSGAAWTEVGDIRRRLGDLDRAEEAFGRAQELCGRPCGELALLRLAQGRVDSAMAVVTGCLRDCGTNRLARARLLPILVHVGVAAGELDVARDALAELTAIVTTYDTAILRATLLSTRGRLQLAERDVVAAVATLQAAIDAWQSLDLPYEVATARTL